MRDIEPRLRQALVAQFGSETGRDATADALAYGWENWSRVGSMDNPVGYLFRVGQSRARSKRPQSALFPPEAVVEEPWSEPGLPAALERLSTNQRTAVLLIHAYGWTYQEVADFFGSSRATVQRHVIRGMEKLRRTLGVRVGT